MKNILKTIFSKNNQEIYSLNGLRAIAIILVILTHSWSFKPYFAFTPPQFMDTVFTNFIFGVDLFLILSGFLISNGLYTTWKKFGKIDYIEFFIKRSFRIFPAYYFYLLIALALLIAMIKSGKLSPDLLELSNLKLSAAKYDFLYISNYKEGLHMHTWSLALEEQFYLIFPFFSSLFFFKYPLKTRFIVLAILYAVPLLFRIYFSISYDVLPYDAFKKILYYPGHTRYDSIILGIFLMELYNNTNFFKEFTKLKISILYFLAFVFLVIGHSIKYNPNSIILSALQFNIMNLGYLFLFSLALYPTSLISKFFSLSIFTPIARVSYGMYLWHVVIGIQAIGIVKKITGTASSSQSLSSNEYILACIIAVIIIFLFAVIIYILIEYPFLKIKEYILKKYKKESLPGINN